MFVFPRLMKFGPLEPHVLPNIRLSVKLNKPVLLPLSLSSIAWDMEQINAQTFRTSIKLSQPI
jgi:hypothetical protein